MFLKITIDQNFSFENLKNISKLKKMEDFGYQKSSANATYGNKNPLANKKLILFLVALASVFGFIFLSIKAYRSMSNDSAKIELVKSPSMPIKTIGENQQINDENADSSRQIYEDIFGNSPLKKAPVKIRSIEEPVSPPSNNFTAQNNEKNSLKTNESPKIEASALKSKSPASQNPVSQNKDENVFKRSDLDQIENRNSPSNSASNSAKNQKEFSKKSAANQQIQQKFRAQIAAVSSKKMAQDAWQKLVEFNPNLFNGLRPFVAEVNSGERGVFYRLQIGEFYSKESAEDFCQKFIELTKRQKNGCLIVE